MLKTNQLLLFTCSLAVPRSFFFWHYNNQVHAMKLSSACGGLEHSSREERNGYGENLYSCWGGSSCYTAARAMEGLCKFLPFVFLGKDIESRERCTIDDLLFYRSTLESLHYYTAYRIFLENYSFTQHRSIFFVFPKATLSSR